MYYFYLTSLEPRQLFATDTLEASEDICQRDWGFFIEESTQCNAADFTDQILAQQAPENIPSLFTAWMDTLYTSLPDSQFILESGSHAVAVKNIFRDIQHVVYWIKDNPSWSNAPILENSLLVRISSTVDLVCAMPGALFSGHNFIQTSYELGATHASYSNDHSLSTFENAELELKHKYLIYENLKHLIKLASYGLQTTAATLSLVLPIISKRIFPDSYASVAKYSTSMLTNFLLLDVAGIAVLEKGLTFYRHYNIYSATQIDLVNAQYPAPELLPKVNSIIQQSQSVYNEGTDFTWASLRAFGLTGMVLDASYKVANAFHQPVIENSHIPFAQLIYRLSYVTAFTGIEANKITKIVRKDGLSSEDKIWALDVLLSGLHTDLQNTKQLCNQKATCCASDFLQGPTADYLTRFNIPTATLTQIAQAHTSDYAKYTLKSWLNL